MSKDSKDQQPHWRPNFSDPSGLPDIKVVRTNFIINFAATLAALLTLFIVGQREYNALTLRQAAQDMEAQVQAADGEDKKNLQLSQKFVDASQEILELERFYASPITSHEVLVELSKLRPEGLLFKNITISEIEKKKGTRSYVVYQIDLIGEVEDPVLLSDFKQSIQESAVIEFEGMSKSIEESLRGRDSKTGIFPYRLMISIQPGGSNKKGAKG